MSDSFDAYTAHCAQYHASADVRSAGKAWFELHARVRSRELTRSDRRLLARYESTLARAFPARAKGTPR